MQGKDYTAIKCTQWQHSQHINQTLILDHLCVTKPYAAEQDTIIAFGHHSNVVYLQIYHSIANVLSYQPHKPTYNQQK